MQYDPVTFRSTVVPTFLYDIRNSNRSLHGTPLGLGDFSLDTTENMESHCTSVSNSPSLASYAKDAVFKTINESFYGTHNFISNDKRTKIHPWYPLTITDSLLKQIFNTFTSYNQGYKYQYSRSVKLEEQLTRDLSETRLLFGWRFLFNILNVCLRRWFASSNLIRINQPIAEHVFPRHEYHDQNGKDLTVIQDFYKVNFKNSGAYAQLQSKLANGLTLTVGARLWL